MMIRMQEYITFVLLHLRSSSWTRFRIFSF